jgi:hypothetical protein
MCGYNRTKPQCFGRINECESRAARSCGVIGFGCDFANDTSGADGRIKLKRDFEGRARLQLRTPSFGYIDHRIAFVWLRDRDDALARRDNLPHLY